MSRLIDADALMEDINRSIDEMTKIGIAVDGEWLWGKLNDALDNAQTIEPEPQWIPCSERLPDVAQRVMLSGHGLVMVGMLHSFDKYSLEPTGISYVYPKGDIEAWMPLPEAYKEGE